MVKVSGLKPLSQKLHRLREETAPKLMQMMGQAADLIVAEQKRLAPVQQLRVGRAMRSPPGRLRDSIGWTFGDAPKYAAVKTRSTNQTRITIFAGNTDVRYAHIIEWGSQSITAQPFFYTGYRITKRRAQSMIAKGVMAEVKKIAKS